MLLGGAKNISDGSLTGQMDWLFWTQGLQGIAESLLDSGRDFFVGRIHFPVLPYLGRHLLLLVAAVESNKMTLSFQLTPVVVAETF